MDAPMSQLSGCSSSKTKVKVTDISIKGKQNIQTSQHLPNSSSNIFTASTATVDNDDDAVKHSPFVQTG